MRRDSIRFYIATRLENLPAARDLSKRLRDEGFEHTYDWTLHGHVYNPHATPEVNEQRMNATARAEIEGVRRADFVIGLLPGGRGTMHELGAALALNNFVILVGPEEILTGECDSAGYPCAFHRHENVVWVSDAEAAVALVCSHRGMLQRGTNE